MTDLIKAVEGLKYYYGSWDIGTQATLDAVLELFRQTPPAPTPASEGDVERVARALAGRYWLDHTIEGYADKESYVTTRWNAFTPDAKAAIAAYNSKPDGEGKL